MTLESSEDRSKFGSNSVKNPQTKFKDKRVRRNYEIGTHLKKEIIHPIRIPDVIKVNFETFITT